MKTTNTISRALYVLLFALFGLSFYVLVFVLLGSTALLLLEHGSPLP
jgi:hypothetical protein